MAKIGRNEPCPCGSGRKYKKCCIDKPIKPFTEEDISNYLNNFWSYNDVKQMSTNEIIKRLKNFGIIFDEDAFLNDIRKLSSVEQIADQWFKDFKITTEGRDEDFLFIAAQILWERLAPEDFLSMEQMSNLIDKGYDFSSEKKYKKASDTLLKVWEALKKYRIKTEFKNLNYLEEQYRGSFFLSNFCQELEIALQNAGMRDKTYYEKRIKYCREFLTYFPEESDLIIHNMRRGIAESYANLGNYEQADLEFKKLVEDYPDNPWGYVGWGDIYFLDKRVDLDKAKELYLKGLTIAKEKDEDVIKPLQNRLDSLEDELRSENEDK